MTCRQPPVIRRHRPPSRKPSRSARRCRSPWQPRSVVGSPSRHPRHEPFRRIQSTSRDGRSVPSPPGTFISIRSAIKPLDPYFFRVAPHLAGDLLAASDDGESVHPDGIDPTDPAAMRDARYYQTVKGPVHPRRGHRAANRVSEGAVSDRPAGTHHLDPGAAGHADANGQALPAVGPVPAVLGMIATALGPTLAHVGADACARLASSRRGMSVWRMAGPTGDLAVKLATDQQPAGSTPYEPAWLIDREAAALRAVGALVGHRLLGTGTAAGAAWLATPWYPAPSAVEVIHRQPPTTDLKRRGRDSGRPRGENGSSMSPLRSPSGSPHSTKPAGSTATCNPPIFWSPARRRSRIRRRSGSSTSHSPTALLPAKLQAIARGQPRTLRQVGVKQSKRRPIHCATVVCPGRCTAAWPGSRSLGR